MALAAVSELTGAERGGFRVARVKECGVMGSNGTFLLKVPKSFYPGAQAWLGQLGAAHGRWLGLTESWGQGSLQRCPGKVKGPRPHSAHRLGARPPLTLRRLEPTPHAPQETGATDWRGLRIGEHRGGGRSPHTHHLRPSAQPQQGGAHPHFSEEQEAQRGEVTCPGSHSSRGRARVKAGWS